MIHQLGAVPFTNTAQAKAAFIAWLKARYPAAYARVAATAPQLLAGLGQDDTTDTTDSGGFGSTLADWGTQLLDIAKAAIPVVAQQQIISAQLSRAKQGLPPLDIKSITPPPVPVQVGVSPSLTSAIGGIGIGTLALGAAAVYLLFGRKGRR